MEDLRGLRERLTGRGYALVRGVFPDEDVRIVKERLRYIARHSKFFSGFGVRFEHETGISNRADVDPLTRFAQISHVLWRDRVCWDHLTAHPNMIRVARAVLGETFYVNNAGCFLKPARHGSRVPWHQDSTTWGLPLDAWGPDDAPLIFDFWIGLDSAGRSNGCLQLLPDSHRRGLVPHRDAGGLLHEADPATFGFDPSAAIAFETSPGDLVVYHQDMFHSSDGNRSDDPRLAGAGSFVAESDVALMRRLRPHVRTLEHVPVCRGGVKVELAESVPTSANPALGALNRLIEVVRGQR